MQYEYFGAYLRELRESRNLTRDQLANNICSPKQIYRIEKGDYEPSLYLLNQLSIKFNLDLNTYYKMHFCNRSITAYSVAMQFESAVNNQNIDEIVHIVDTYKSHKDFQEGLNLQYIYYGQALISVFQDRDYLHAIEYCIKGIRVDVPTFTLNNIRESFYSNSSINMISLLASCHSRLNNCKLSIQISEDLLYSLEYFVFQSPLQFNQISDFIKKVYHRTLFSLSLFLFDYGTDENVLEIIDKGIDFANKMNNIKHLPELFTMKFQVLLRSGDIDNAKLAYQKAYTLLEITEQPIKIQELKDYVKDNYPDLDLN